MTIHTRASELRRIKWDTNVTARRVVKYVRQQEEFCVPQLAKALKIKQPRAKYYVDGLLIFQRIKLLNPGMAGSEVYRYAWIGNPDWKDTITSEQASLCFQELQELADSYSRGELVSETPLREHERFARESLAILEREYKELKALVDNPDLWWKRTLVQRLIYGE